MVLTVEMALLMQLVNDPGYCFAEGDKAVGLDTEQLNYTEYEYENRLCRRQQSMINYSFNGRLNMAKPIAEVSKAMLSIGAVVYRKSKQFTSAPSDA